MCRSVKIKLTYFKVRLLLRLARSLEDDSRPFYACWIAVWSKYGRILFKFSTTKNGRVITLEVLYEGKFTWLYGNRIFMMFRCSPS